MPNYKIKLTPVDTFFFGGEKHDENGKVSYFVESNLYPQQTTLLGLIRYYLLLKNPSIFKDNKIVKGSNVADFIGTDSFDYANKNTDKNIQSFGKIKSLSPLYFHSNGKDYFFGPLDFDTEIDDHFILSKTDRDGKAEKYKAKLKDTFISQQLIAKDGTAKLLFGENGILSDAEQVGNEKAHKGESTKENAFYKMNMKRMAKGWSFVVDVDIEDGAGVIDKEHLFIPFGGEKCYFKMEIEEVEKYTPHLPSKYKRNLSTVVCISDCFLSDVSLLHSADFAITEAVSFRNLKSKASENVNYSGLSKNDPNQLSRSQRYNLLKRGSVLYFTDNQKMKILTDALETESNSRAIGFNQFLTITKS